MALKKIKCFIVGDGYVLLIELRQNKTCLSSLRSNASRFLVSLAE